MPIFSQRPHLLRLWILVCFFHFSGLNNSYCYEFPAAALNLRDSVSFAGWMVQSGMVFFSPVNFKKCVNDGRRLVFGWGAQAASIRSSASRASALRERPARPEPSGQRAFLKDANGSYQWSYQESADRRASFRRTLVLPRNRPVSWKARIPDPRSRELHRLRTALRVRSRIAGERGRRGLALCLRIPSGDVDLPHPASENKQICAHRSGPSSGTIFYL